MGKRSWKFPLLAVHFHLLLASPSPGSFWFTPIFSHICCVQFLAFPGFGGSCWLFLFRHFPWQLDFSFSRLENQFPLLLPLSIFQKFVTSDLWWFILFHSHCPCCLSGILERRGDKLMYVSGCSFYSVLGCLLLARLQEGRELVSFFVTLSLSKGAGQILN